MVSKFIQDLDNEIVKNFEIGMLTKVPQINDSSHGSKPTVQNTLKTDSQQLLSVYE